MRAAAEPSRSRRYLGLLAELMDELAEAGDIAQVARGVLRRLTEAMGAEAASLFLLEGELGEPQARLVCAASAGPSDVTGLSLPAASGIIGRALRENASQLVNDVRGDPDFLPPADPAFRIRSLICVPLAVRGERLGAVEVMNRRASGAKFGAKDVELLEMLAAAAALALANARLTQRLMEQARLQRELELAADVQRMLLPPAQPAGAPAHGLSLPARGVSGDFYDLVPLPDGRTVFALADVSGKGLNAALIMVKAHTLFRSFARKVHAPGLLLARIEAELADTMAFGMFVTMIVGILDPAQRLVVFSNAGHEPPLLRDESGGYASLPATDPPLGVISRLRNRRYHEERVALGTGSLYLYTDGVTEGRSARGQVLGVEGLKALIEASAHEPPAARLKSIAGAIAHGDEALHDDLTLLVLESRDPVSRARRRERRRPGRSLVVDQSIPARIGELRVIRRLVTAAAIRVGASPDWARDLALAVDEACQNIIRHGYGGECEARIQLRLKRLADRVVVELVDFAPPVTEDKCRGRRLDELRPGGLGVHFMHALTDQVRFLAPPAGAGNRLVLTKKLADRRAKARP